MSQREMTSTKSSHVETIIQMGLNMEDTSNLFKIAINSYGSWWLTLLAFPWFPISFRYQTQTAWPRQGTAHNEAGPRLPKPPGSALVRTCNMPIDSAACIAHPTCFLVQSSYCHCTESWRDTMIHINWRDNEVKQLKHPQSATPFHYLNEGWMTWRRNANTKLIGLE